MTVSVSGPLPSALTPTIFSGRRISMSKIPVVNQDECISCGLCVETCPEVFRLNDKDLSEVYNPTGASEEKIQEAIDSCPVQCIQWEE
jgi:ferredoxin